MAANTATVSCSPLSSTAATNGVARQSIFTNALCSLAAGDTLTLTVVHRLGASPDKVSCVLRSVIANVSFQPLAAAVIGWNASVATISLAFGGLSPAYQANYDVICEAVHSIVM